MSMKLELLWEIRQFVGSRPVISPNFIPVDVTAVLRELTRVSRFEFSQSWSSIFELGKHI